MTEPEELVRSAIDAHNRGPEALLALFDELFDPDFEYTPMTVGAVGTPDDATYRGRDGMRRFYDERAEAFAEGRVEIRSCERAGQEAVMVHAHSTGTGRASGAQVDEEITLVYWVRGGKAVRARAFRSREEAAEAADA
jgi:ketosteroid isomerase-like protein